MEPGNLLGMEEREKENIVFNKKGSLRTNKKTIKYFFKEI